MREGGRDGRGSEGGRGRVRDGEVREGGKRDQK